MAIQTNPFGFNRPISEHKHFIGRREELRSILRAVLHGHSVFLVGMPKVGSSSLLKCALLPEMTAEFEVSLPLHLPVYLNLHAMPTANPRQLFETVLAELERQAQRHGAEPAAQDDPTPVEMGDLMAHKFQSYIQRFAALRRRGIMPVIMIDELDFAVTNPKMDLSLFKLMLYLRESDLATFVTSSHTQIDMIEATIRAREGDYDDRSSREITASLYLEPFTQEEAERYLNQLPPALQANSKLKELLLALSGGHPYLLQLACYHAVEQHEQQQLIDLAALWHAFNHSAEPLFNMLWETATEYTRSLLRTADHARLKRYSLRKQSESRIGAARIYLLSSGGILRPTGDDYDQPQIFSYAFGHYVMRRREQEAIFAGRSPHQLAQLRQVMSDNFALDELRTLSFDLGVDFENLAGETKEGKARELITLMARNGRLQELVATGRRHKPQAPWP
jgi:hypothetical protein